MKWFSKEDNTPGVITAHGHVNSDHRDYKAKRLPKNAIVFCLSKWDKAIMESFDAFVYTEKLVRFFGSTPVYCLNGNDDWCFLHGGVGSPQIADTIESIHELGVDNVILVGMVGGFGVDINIKDIVIPSKILSEEGTSIHYVGYKKFANVKSKDKGLIKALENNGFNVNLSPTVTTDAVYRQTFYKEAYWRDNKCVGVDMEGSAFINVANYLGMNAKCIYVVSDKHPEYVNQEKTWKWGVTYEDRKKFIETIIKYCIS